MMPDEKATEDVFADTAVTMESILKLLLNTERKLEDWICDMICDNIPAYLATTNGKYVDVLEDIIISEMYNTRLWLRLTDIILNFPTDNTYLLELQSGTAELTLPTVWLDNLSPYPCEVFKLFSSEKMVLRLFRDKIGNGWANKLVGYLEHFSTSSNLNIVQSVVQCLVQLIHLERGLFPKIQVSDSIKISVLAGLFQQGNPGTAVTLLQEHYPQLELPSKTELNNTLLVPLHVYQCVVKYPGETVPTGGLEEPALDTDPKEETTSPKDPLDLDTVLSYDSTTLYWKSLYKLLFSSKCSGRLLEEVLQKLAEHRNTTVLNLITKLYTSDGKDLQPTLDIVRFMNLLCKHFAESKLLQCLLDAIYDECNDTKSYLSALSFLGAVISLNTLDDIVAASHVCHHYVKCDVMDMACFCDTLITYLTECRTERFGPVSELATRLFNTPTFADVYNKSVNKNIKSRLDMFLLRKIKNPDTSVQYAGLDMISKLKPHLLQQDIISNILQLSCSDPDIDVKTAAFQILSAVQTDTFVAILPDLDERIGVLSKQLVSVEYDDSSVAIAFIGYFSSKYQLYSSFVEENIRKLASENQKNTPDSNSNRVEIAHPAQDVDSIINIVCNARDCSDVPIITRYHDKHVTSSEHVTSQSRVTSDLFRVLTTDRCDVERVNVSVNCITMILSNLPDTSRSYLVSYLGNTYFSLINSYNSPHLTPSVQSLKSVLSETGFEGESGVLECGREVQRSHDLSTVLVLLQSTPDPDIVMDCY